MITTVIFGILVYKLPETATAEKLNYVAEVQTSTFDSLNVFGRKGVFVWQLSALYIGR